MFPDLSVLPADYRELRALSPQGFQVSDLVVDPCIVLERDGFSITAKLAGVRRVRNEKKLIFALSAKHNWIIDGTTIRPLPVDAPSAFESICGTNSFCELSYDSAIRIANSTGSPLEIHAAPNLLLSAADMANSLQGDAQVDGLHATLFPYQSRGVQWLHSHLKNSSGAILADEMGLGKTVQIIAALLLDPPSEIEPALVVCPTSLITNWSRELKRFSPSLDYLVHLGPSRAGVYRKLMMSKIVITTYETLVSDLSIFRSVKWSYVICDEAQAIKNPDSNRRSAIASIPKRRALAVTGTPVENTLLDLWSLVDFTNPGLLGTRAVFEQRYPDTIESAQSLSKITDPIILKRRVKDVAQDLPERIDVDFPLIMDELQVRHYSEVRQATMEKYATAGALVATLQLQLLCAHPWLRLKSSDVMEADDVEVIRAPDIPLMTPKMERVVSLLREAFYDKKKVLIFSVFNAIGDLIKEACLDLPTALWGAINGDTPQSERQSIVDDFSGFDGPACLILNPRAAGAGLNITAATIVIHYTPVWNPAIEAQASARAHRRGQSLPVTVYRLFYEDTVERVMIDRSSWKHSLGNEVTPIGVRDSQDLRRALCIEPRLE